MALGNNRDYKTATRRAFKQLAEHKKRMDALMAKGVSKAEASSQALAEMEKKPQKFTLDRLQTPE